MNEQPLFDERAWARSTDPETSWWAADSVKDLRSTQAAVLDVFADGYYLTDEGLADIYAERVQRGTVPRQSPSGLRTRRSELVAKGLIIDSGDRRRTPTGRWAIVWRIV